MLNRIHADYGIFSLFFLVLVPVELAAFINHRWATSKGSFIATQLNSTELNSTAWTTVDLVGRSWRHKQKHDWLCCTLFNWVSWVQLSWVELCRYKHPLTLGQHALSTRVTAATGDVCVTCGYTAPIIDTLSPPPRTSGSLTIWSVSLMCWVVNFVTI